MGSDANKIFALQETKQETAPPGAGILEFVK